MKRRAFLQRSLLTLAALELGEAGISLMANRYQNVLAEPTPRKLALLVGINQYRSLPPLEGCLTDVELQQELLLHRFGFQPSDILTLTDQQATREAIEAAFVNHLGQAQAGDTVVFHFSGYGGSVASSTSEIEQTSLVTVDDPQSNGEIVVVNDLLEDTLLLLLRSLPTDKITTILDTSYTYRGKPLQGNLRIRSRPQSGVFQPSAAELATRSHLLSQTNLDPEQIAIQRRSGQMRGVVLAAAKPGQVATEAKWSGFNAGLFTYALTQHLWQTTTTTVLRVSLGRTTSQVNQLVHQEQQPQLSGQKSQDRSLLPYYLPPTPAQGVDGVITVVEGDKVQLWLGGLSASILEQYGANALLALVIPNSSSGPLQLQILSREGLTAKAKVYNAASIAALEVGQFVQEGVRVVAHNPELILALDSNLERIERVDAVSALSTVPHVSTAIAGEHAADYLFSKTQDQQPTQVAALPDAPLPGIVPSNTTQSSYGLFSPGRNAISNTAGEAGEAVKAAIRRLVPKLQTLLAAKLLSSMTNESSQIAMRATLEMITPQTRTLLQRETRSTVPLPAEKGIASPAETAGLISLPIGSRIQYRLENHSSEPIYFVVLGLDNGGNLVSLYSPPRSTDRPPETSASTSSTVDSSNQATPAPAQVVTPSSERSTASIGPGETLTLPQASTAFEWVLRAPVGLADTYLIASRSPFKQTATVLATQHHTGDTADLSILSNPLEVAQAVLQDLQQASQPTTQSIALPPDTFALDVNAWASLQFSYQVV